MFKYWLKLTIILYLLWLLLSGKPEAKFLIVGLVAAGVFGWICLRAMWIPNEQNTRRFSLLDVPLGRFALYLAWLFKEIVKASLDVARRVCMPHMDVQPQVIYFACPFENPIATTLLVNSIILTPGTVTLDVEEQRMFVVHALTDSAAAGLLEGEMQRRIGALFGETFRWDKPVDGGAAEPADANG